MKPFTQLLIVFCVFVSFLRHACASESPDNIQPPLKIIYTSKSVNASPQFEVKFEVNTNEIRARFQTDTVYWAQIRLQADESSPILSINNPAKKGILVSLGNRSFGPYKRHSVVRLPGKRAVLVVYDPSISENDALMTNGLDRLLLGSPIFTASTLNMENLRNFEAEVQKIVNGTLEAPRCFVAVIEHHQLETSTSMPMSSSLKISIVPASRTANPRPQPTPQGQGPSRSITFVQETIPSAAASQPETASGAPVVTYMSPALESGSPIQLDFNAGTKTFHFKFKRGIKDFNAKYQLTSEKGFPVLRGKNQGRGGVLLYDLFNGAGFGIASIGRRIQRREVAVFYEQDHLQRDADFSARLSDVIKKSNVFEEKDTNIEKFERLRSDIKNVLEDFNKYFSGFYLVIIDPPTTSSSKSSSQAEVPTISNIGSGGGSAISSSSSSDERPAKRTRFSIDNLLESSSPESSLTQSGPSKSSQDTSMPLPDPRYIFSDIEASNEPQSFSSAAIPAMDISVKPEPIDPDEFWTGDSLAMEKAEVNVDGVSAKFVEKILTLKNVIGREATAAVAGEGIVFGKTTGEGRFTFYDPMSRNLVQGPVKLTHGSCIFALLWIEGALPIPNTLFEAINRLSCQSTPEKMQNILDSIHFSNPFVMLKLSRL